MCLSGIPPGGNSTNLKMLRTKIGVYKNHRKSVFRKKKKITSKSNVATLKI